jgi:uncharacterized protein involved in exopolysaccharide biosynthesis
MKLQHDPAGVNGHRVQEQRISPYQEVLQILGRRKRRILFTVALAVALGTLYCLRTGPWYDSGAQLLVIKKKLDTAPISGPDQARVQEDYLSTHMLLITSRRVIVDAVKRGRLQELEQFRDTGGGVLDWLTGPASGGGQLPPEEKVATEIINTLVVTRDAARPGISPSNEILNLSYRGKVAADCPRILNAIIDSYQAFLKETYRNTNAEALELITQAREMVQKDLEAKEASYQKFLADTPPLWKGAAKGTAHQDRVLQLDAKLSALRVRRAELAAAIEMLERALKSGRNPRAILERLAALAANRGQVATTPPTIADPALADRRPGISLEEELAALQLQEAKLLALRAPKHPDVIALRRHMKTVRNMILPSSGASEGVGSDRDLGKVKIELLRQELDDLNVTERSLVKLFDEEKKGVSASYSHEIQDEAHRKGIERDRLLYESILNRLKETSSVRDFGGYNTQVIGPALHGRLAAKKYLLIVGLCVFTGLFAGFGWAYLLEMSAQRARGKASGS